MAVSRNKRITQINLFISKIPAIKMRQHTALQIDFIEIMFFIRIHTKKLLTLRSINYFLLLPSTLLPAFISLSLETIWWLGYIEAY